MAIEDELMQQLWLGYSHPHLAHIAEKCYEAAQTIKDLRAEIKSLKAELQNISNEADDISKM